MINTLYIEEEIKNHPRCIEICERFADADLIYCKHYGEVFNPKSQNFRLQKINPSLILAKKHKGFVLTAPDGYSVGGDRNYYFSHMLNCVYDCRYCFLQGMYRSAHYILFVNYEDFETGIMDTIGEDDNQTWFFSGYDCDSLAMDPVTRFVDYFLPVFARFSNAYIELRTKSTQIRSLLSSNAIDNAVIAYSFTPEEISEALENNVPSLQKRLKAMLQLQKSGWKLGLRFDPLIYHENFRRNYQLLFEQIFSILDINAIHSVSLGVFRLPKQFHKNIIKLYPDEKLFAGPLEEHEGIISYKTELEMEISNYCNERLLSFVPKERLFPCVF